MTRVGRVRPPGLSLDVQIIDGVEPQRCNGKLTVFSRRSAASAAAVRGSLGDGPAGFGGPELERSTWSPPVS